MSTTQKPLSIAAFETHAGKTIGTYAPWGGATIPSLGANQAFDYVEINVAGKVAGIPDESIDSQAFADTPAQGGIFSEGEISGIVNYVGLGRFWYWAFGYEDAGTSPQTLGGGYYSHLFELDEHERHVTSYRTAEQTAGDYASTDRKVRLGVLGIKRGPNDHRYQQIMCEGFTMGSRAGEGLKYGLKWVGYKETRGDYTSSGWTFPTGSSGTANKAYHPQLVVSLGPPGALVALGCTEVNLSVEFPLAKEQDSASGLYLAEPVLAGKVSVKPNITLTRHSVDTYLAYRDAWTTLCMKWVWTFGSYEFGLYFPDVRIVDSNVTGDEVARNPIVFETGNEPNKAAGVFAATFAGHSIIQGSPVYLFTKNQSSTNEMRRN